MKKIFTSGEKVKSLMDMVHAKQKDFEMNGLTRGHLSNIINDKRTLVSDTGQKIIDRVNELAAFKNIDIPEISLEDLLESERYQANRYIDEYCRELTKTIKTYEEYNEKKAEIEQFISINKKYIYPTSYSKINLSYTEALCNLNLLAESEAQYYIAYSFAAKIDDYKSMIKLLLIRANIYSRTNRMDEIINLVQFAFSLLTTYKIHDEELVTKLYFDIAYAYKALKNYALCIKYAEELKKQYKLDYELAVRLEIIEANCYLDSERYEVARNRYINLLDNILHAGDNDNISRVYRNLAELSLKLKDYEKVDEYTQITIKLIDNKSLINKAITLYCAILNYIEMNRIQYIRTNYMDAILNLNKIEDITRIYDLIDKLVDYFIEKKLWTELQNLLTHVEGYIYQDKYKNKLLLTKFYKAACCFSCFDEHIFKELNEKAIKIEEYFKNYSQ